VADEPRPWPSSTSVVATPSCLATRHDRSRLDLRSLQSVQTGGREQIEVEYRDAAGADHEEEHDSAVRPPQCGLVAFGGSRSVESVAQGILLRN